MTEAVPLPLWLVALLALAASWLALEKLFVPTVRFLLRRRVDRVLAEVNPRLDIHVQPFKLVKRRVLIERLLYDGEVAAAADSFAAAEGISPAEVRRKVERYAREIVPAFNAYLYFRFGYWLSRRLARTLYRVRIGYVDEAALARVPRGATVVFVMNHRSNMDYVLVSHMVAERTALSYAVGEWARIFPLEQLIRAMGAYFVRRRSRNALYRRVLARYVAMATAEGVTQAVYPEGGLSRDGRLAPPRLGLIDYMLRSFDPEGERDLVFVPVGLNYDRVLEDRTLILDGDAAAPRRRGLGAALTTAGFLLKNFRLWALGDWYRFGYACVSFGSPLSMRAHFAARGLDPRRLDRSRRFAEVERVGEELMRRVGAVVPVVPVALVARVLSRRPERTWSRRELSEAVAAESRRLAAAGASLYVPRGDEDYAVEVGLRMLLLRRVLAERDGELALAPGQLPLVAYYARSIAHLAVGMGQRPAA